MIRMLFITSLFILIAGPPIGEMDSIHTPRVNWHRSCLITGRLVMIPSEVPSASNFLQYFGCVLSDLITVSRLPVFYTDPLRKDMEMILRYLPHQSQPAMQPTSFNSPPLSTLIKDIQCLSGVLSGPSLRHFWGELYGEDTVSGEFPCFPDIGHHQILGGRSLPPTSASFHGS